MKPSHDSIRRWCESHRVAKVPCYCTSIYCTGRKSAKYYLVNKRDIKEGATYAAAYCRNCAVATLHQLKRVDSRWRLVPTWVHLGRIVAIVAASRGIQHCEE